MTLALCSIQLTALHTRSTVVLVRRGACVADSSALCLFVAPSKGSIAVTGSLSLGSRLRTQPSDLEQRILQATAHASFCSSICKIRLVPEIISQMSDAPLEV